MSSTIKTKFGTACLDENEYYRISSNEKGNRDKKLHRLIMKPILDYLNYKYSEILWVVHHKNGNTLDNRFENLQAMSTQEHNRLHHKGKILSKEHTEKLKISNSIRMKKNNPMKNPESVKKMLANRELPTGKLNHKYRKDVPSGAELYKLNMSGITQKKLSKKYNCHARLIEKRIHDFKKRNNITKNKSIRYDLPDNSYFRLLYFQLGFSYPQIGKFLNCSLRTAWRKVNAQ